MNQILLDLPLRRASDLIRARQRGRQIAALLGYPRDQHPNIAAAVFEIAGQTDLKRGATVRFQIDGDLLQVFAVPRTSLRLEIELPLKARLDRAELAWAVQTLDALTPLDVRHELRQMNQELMRALHELRGPQEEQATAVAA